MLIIYVAIVLFTLRTVWFIYGAAVQNKKTQFKVNNNYRPFVSVIVPARNEEKNIRRAIEFLDKNDYPKSNYEIIAVNDRSTDKTLEILNELQKTVVNLRVIDINEASTNPNLRGKAGALNNGIKQAKGEIIMMTDADCESNPNWISNIVSHFDKPQVKMVTSYTNIMGERVFDKLQAVQWIYLTKMSSAGPTYNYPLGCFGTNLSMKIETYNEIGGYENIPFSVTEDYALLKEVMNRGYEVLYIQEPNATMNTHACDTFPELISQLRRWAKGGLDLKWVAYFFVLTSVAVWAGLVTSLLLQYYWTFFLLLFIRLLGDFLLVVPTLIDINKKSLIKWTYPSIFFFMCLELIIPPLLLSRKIKWKGQIFR